MQAQESFEDQSQSLHAAEARVEELITLLTEAESRGAVAITELDDAKAGVAELEQKVAKMMAKLNTVNQDLQEAQMATMEAAMEKDAVSAERDAVRSECEEIKAQLGALLSRTAALEEAVTKAKGVIEALQVNPNFGVDLDFNLKLTPTLSISMTISMTMSMTMTITIGGQSGPGSHPQPVREREDGPPSLHGRNYSRGYEAFGTSRPVAGRGEGRVFGR